MPTKVTRAVVALEPGAPCCHMAWGPQGVNPALVLKAGYAMAIRRTYNNAPSSGYSQTRIYVLCDFTGALHPGTLTMTLLFSFYAPVG